MGFQFVRAEGVEDVADNVYEMPPLPLGVSYSLRKLIETYTQRVLGNDPAKEDDAFAAIDRFKPNGLPDAIAKLLYGLHYDTMGSDGERLLIIDTPDKTGRIMATQSAIADLYSLMPQGWAATRAYYEAARAVEQDYDRRVWGPAWQQDNAGLSKVPASIEAEMERLQDIRCEAENVLLDTPAPDLAAFAFKYLICFDDDRDLNGHHEALCAEAKRLIAETTNG